MSQLIIFEWNHVLAVPQSGETFRKSGEPYKWIEDPERLHSSRKELLEHLYSNGASLAVVDNEGGIAFNIIGLEDTKDKIFTLLKELDFFVPFLVCPCHPDRPASYQAYAVAKWRMPEPGMLSHLWHLFPEVYAVDVLVVGHRDEVKEAARRAGFRYEEAEPFFSRVEIDLETFIADEQNADEDFNHEPPTGEPPDLEALALVAEDDDDGPPF